MPDDIGGVLSFREPWCKDTSWSHIICDNTEVHAVVQVLDNTPQLRERIVVCVNACAGLDDPKTKMLELGALLHDVLNTLDASSLLCSAVAAFDPSDECDQDRIDNLIKQASLIKATAEKVRAWQRS